MILPTARTKDRRLGPRQALKARSVDLNAGRHSVPGGRAHKDQGAHGGLLKLRYAATPRFDRNEQKPTAGPFQDTRRAAQQSIMVQRNRQPKRHMGEVHNASDQVRLGVDLLSTSFGATRDLEHPTASPSEAVLARL